AARGESRVVAFGVSGVRAVAGHLIPNGKVSNICKSGCSRNSGHVEIGRAADTADTALRPLARSSALTAPCAQVTPGFVQLPPEASNGQETSPRRSQIQNIIGARSCLCTWRPSAV